MPPFKDEHILMIAPGSHTTLAQLGLPESYIPASFRTRTRMFPAPDGKWEAVKIRPVTKAAELKNDAEGDAQPDVSIQEEPEFVQDPESDEDAVYPLTEGAITNMPAFLALLQHIHNTLSPTLHTPILLVAQPAWTAQQLETLTQFFFERFKIPAFCILDSALATAYAYGPTSCLVVDVGYEKTDITAVTDFQLVHKGRTVALRNAGGDSMTKQLLRLLEPKGWTKDMCEQLKKNSTLCEILPSGVPLPEPTAGANTITKDNANPAALASTGASTSGPSAHVTQLPRGPGPDTEVGDEQDIIDDKLEDDGVLDVASIVASGKTAEFLAAQERKKAAVAQRKATREANLAAEAATARPVRLPNSKREKAIFHYQKRRTIEEIEEAQKAASIADEPSAATTQALPKEPAPEMMDTSGDASTTVPLPINPDATAPVSTTDEQNATKDQARAVKRDEKRKARDGADLTLIRKEIEIGTERFQASTPEFLEHLADAIHRTVLSLPEIGRRSEIWDSIIMVGKGSKVKGFKEALLQTLTTRYLISPSSATMFTSELPSNLSTPMGTGSQTPMRDSPLPMGQFPLPSANSNVNQLLVAATTASNAALPSPYPNNPHHNHVSHSQSPTSIKTLKHPEYFPEFKAFGYEEAAFLGAQVAAKCIFVVDQGVSGGFLTRVQYNESGPAAIHELGFV